MSNKKTPGSNPRRTPPLILLRPDATDEELQAACDILNEARRRRIAEHLEATSPRDVANVSDAESR